MFCRRSSSTSGFNLLLCLPIVRVLVLELPPCCCQLRRRGRSSRPTTWSSESLLKKRRSDIRRPKRMGADRDALGYPGYVVIYQCTWSPNADFQDVTKEIAVGCRTKFPQLEELETPDSSICQKDSSICRHAARTRRSTTRRYHGSDLNFLSTGLLRRSSFFLFLSFSFYSSSPPAPPSLLASLFSLCSLTSKGKK